MRVLLVSHFYPPHQGGIENVVNAEAHALAARGHRVSVFTTGEGGAVDDDGVRVVRIPAWNPTESFGVPFPLLKPRQALAALRDVGEVDVVHVHDVYYPTSWLAFLLARRRGARLVLSQHVAAVEHPALPVRWVQHAVAGLAGRPIVRHATAIVYLNERVRVFLEGLGARDDQLVFVPNGVDHGIFHPLTPAVGALGGSAGALAAASARVLADAQKRPQSAADADTRASADIVTARAALRRELGLPVDELLFTFVGRFVPKKGYDVLRECADPAYRLVFVGGTPRADEPADPRLTHLGRRSQEQVADIYRASDAFVLPSTSEGFPLTVQEAMACGLPCVVGDDPGYTSYAMDRRGLAHVKPTVAAVRATLKALAADAGLRQRMADYSIAASARFSWDAHIEVIERCYGHAPSS